MSSDDTTVVAELVARALDSGGRDIARIPFDEICAGHPHLQSDVIEGVRVALTLPDLHAEGDVDHLASRVFAGRFRLEQRIGSGAMGVVYEATDLDLGRPVAIKVMQGNLLERSTALARFEREASALAAVQHPSVVTIYDRGVTAEGTPYLAMELVHGVSCARILELARERHGDDDDTGWLIDECGLQRVEETSFLRQVMRWAADVASGLARAHAAGVVHRDVKPSNIIVRPDGKAVLLDFGIAAKRDQETLTQTGAAVGTPAYMAPEALDGSKEARPSQDVYGLAATLYHMLTLQAPYRGTAQEVLASIATREPVPAARLRPGIPRDAQAILDHGLARDPRSRYASLADMESDLRALLAYRPVSVRPTTTLTRFWRRARRSRVALGAAVALGAVGLLWGVNGVRAAWALERDITFDRVYPAIIANLGLVKRENRVVPAGPPRESLRSNLDALVATGREPLIALNLRAAFRLDHGDREGAWQDIQRIASIERTPFTRALALRYAAVADAAGDIGSLDLSGLPQVRSAGDAYVAGYHEMRQKRFEAGAAFLADERLAGNRHAQELRALWAAVPLDGLRLEGHYGELTRLGARVLALAGSAASLGRTPGATARHVMGAAFLNLGMYRRSLAESRALLEASPWSHVSLQNVAEASRHLGEVESGLASCDRALALAPDYLPLLAIKIRLLALDGRFDEAREIARGIEFDANDPRGESQRLVLLIRIGLLELEAGPSSDQGRSARLMDDLEAQLAQLDSPDDQRFRSSMEALVRAYRGGDPRDVAMAKLTELKAHPTSLRELGQLLALLPESPDPELWGAVRAFLERLHGHLSISGELEAR